MLLVRPMAAFDGLSWLLSVRITPNLENSSNVAKIRLIRCFAPQGSKSKPRVVKISLKLIFNGMN
ncbi:MAG: hypothetical protein ACI97A_003147 [Planctomycetota bacterium]|jgi:hypothetical protein